MTRHCISIDEPFVFEAGGSIPHLDIVYHCSERAYRKGDKVLWICHALTANSNPEEWWSDLTGPGKLFDTEKYFVICPNIFGSPYGTTGPASINPATGRPYMFDFPQISIRDIARLCILLRKKLGIDKVDFLVGSSVGGFYAAEWCIMEPDTIRKAALIATATRATPYLTAYNESQRMALEADQTFREAASLKGGEKGLQCARSIALISYRSYDGYNATQSEADPDTFLAGRAASYQRHQGRKLSDRFDAYSYWYLTIALDSHNVGRGRGGEKEALRSIKADTTVIAIESDCLFPKKDMKKTARMIPGAKYTTIKSKFGHDGFLLEYKQLSDIIRPLITTD